MEETMVMNEIINTEVSEEIAEAGLDVISNNSCKGKAAFIVLGVTAVITAGVIVYNKVIKPKKQKGKDNVNEADEVILTEDDVEVVSVDTTDETDE